MRTTLSRFACAIAGIAALAAGAAIVPTTPAVQALPPDTPPAGSVVLTPSSGTSSQTFAMSFPNPPQFCPGDATANYRWGTFLTSIENDPATLTYTASGSPIAPAGTYAASLRDPVGSQLRAFNPGLSDGLVVAPSSVSFTNVTFATLPAGEYWIGIVCTRADANFVVQTEKFWATPITITAQAGAGTNNFVYSVGIRPQAPTLTAANPGDAQCTAAFTPGAADPAASSYTVTATPQGGGAAVTQDGAGSPIVVSGLTNGTAYDITVTATNTVGTSDPSNSLACTPALAGQPPVQGLQVIPGAETCSVSFNPPAGIAPTGYEVTVAPSVPGSPFTVPAAGPYTLELADLEAGVEYTITVTPQYAAPDFGTADSETCIPTSAQFIVQQVSVTRPPGALVLTQRCGVYGSLDAETAVDAFPGYPRDLAAAAAVAGPGTAPTLDPEGTTPDPEFGEYPNPVPASYPTYCGLELGTAELVTSGELAGYYTAAGRLNQVSVLDTRDGDPGWTLNGEMSAFDDGFGVGFEGSYLGWSPKVSDVTVTPGYTQVVAAGAAVAPGTGIPGDTGLGNGETLASAGAGEGLGVATLDARIKLLIPPSVPAGDYAGELTLSFL